MHSGMVCLASQAPDRAASLWDGLSGLGLFKSMIGVYLSVSIVSFAVIGYHFNCMDGQLNCQALTHCIIGRATKLLTVQSVICGMAHHIHRKYMF